MSDDVRIFTFKALDIGQEHWTMASVPCVCGGRWQAGEQAMVDGPDGPMDAWEARCGTCGAQAVFRFDVAAFFGHKVRLEAWLAERLPDVEPKVRDRIARKVGPPFGTRFQSLVQGLGKDGDVATLRYLRWQIDRALAVAQGGAGDDGGDEGEEAGPAETVN